MPMIFLLAAALGIVGATALTIVEHWYVFPHRHTQSTRVGQGMTWHGGLLLGTAAMYLYARATSMPWGQFLDAAAPALILGEAIGRLGCHFAGDGDYGFPTDLPWGTNYENGTLPPSRALAIFPQVTARYAGGVVPDNTPCHPTPVYEFILLTGGFVLLWQLRKRDYAPGKLFAIYLMLSGTSRFAVEFLRLNPRVVIGLSQAQLISIALVGVGLIGIVCMYLRDAKVVGTETRT